jgi:hypothetical protein
MLGSSSDGPARRPCIGGYKRVMVSIPASFPQPDFCAILFLCRWRRPEMMAEPTIRADRNIFLAA